MREIKFRAWDKNKKEMCEVIELIHNGKYAKLFGLTNKWLEKKFSKSFELMQFTGLKDKNRKEIYEGDILVAVGNINIYFLVGFGDDTDKEYFGFTLESLNRTKMIYSFCRDVERYEVIGNIYESPKLLDTVKC